MIKLLHEFHSWQFCCNFCMHVPGPTWRRSEDYLHLLASLRYDSDGSTGRKSRGSMAGNAVLLQQRAPWWASTILLIMIGPRVHAAAHFWMSARIDPLKGPWRAPVSFWVKMICTTLCLFISWCLPRVSECINQIETKRKPLHLVWSGLHGLVVTNLE